MVRTRRYDWTRWILLGLLGSAFLMACDAVEAPSAGPAGEPPALLRGKPGGGGGAPPPPSVTKTVSFAVLEDYDKGHDLTDVALDFQLMNELGIDVMRCSFGWDDYEPARGQYDFAWLEQFVMLAAQYGIRLRPYIAYTAPWAADGGSGDGVYWNDPPASLQDWHDFVYNLAATLSVYPNVLSYEIYNEENDAFWWDGTLAEYNAVLQTAATAIRAADADAEIILGGFVFPEYEWIDGLCTTHGNGGSFDVAPFHAYPETWSRNNIVVENYLDTQYHDFYVPTVNQACGGQPIWINETGYATTPGRTEAQQADWWARAVSTFLADPEIEHIGVYEIKDLPEGSPVIGDEANYYLGITRADRTRKLAFYTVDLLTDLLTGTLTTADAEATVDVTSGRARKLYHHLFKRPGGSQVLFVYDKAGSPTVRITLNQAGGSAVRYALDGTASAYPLSADGKTLSGVQLEAGTVAIFKIDPL